MIEATSDLNIPDKHTIGCKSYDKIIAMTTSKLSTVSNIGVT